MAVVPLVETERRSLGGMTREDFLALAVIWQEPEVVRFLGGKPRHQAESRAILR